MYKVGQGTFFDGKTSARQEVGVELVRSMLVIRGAEGAMLVRWPYEDLQRVASPSGWLRLGRHGARLPARLEIRDPSLSDAVIRLIAARPPRPRDRRQRRRVIVWSVFAMAVLAVIVVFGIPLIADRLAR